MVQAALNAMASSASADPMESSSATLTPTTPLAAAVILQVCPLPQPALPSPALPCLALPALICPALPCPALFFGQEPWSARLEEARCQSYHLYSPAQWSR